MVRHSDLIRQKEYRGRGLVWTGYMVNPKFADLPNAQNLTPLVKMDPVPIADSRPDSQINAENTLATSVGTLDLDVTGNSNITLTEEQFDNGSFNFNGVLSGDIIIFVPNIYNQFYANNLTTGPFSLSMRVVGNAPPTLLIPPANAETRLGPSILNNTTNGLKFISF
jgi:hypothetical protein